MPITLSGSNGVVINSNTIIDGSGNLTLPGDITLVSGSLASPATAGLMEYDGIVPYFTPQGTQRGVIPGMQYFRLNANLVGTNATGAQNVFGVGCTLSSSTVYAFESSMVFTRTAGTTSHTIASGFGGTATVNNIHYLVFNMDQNLTVNQRGTVSIGAAAVTQTSATIVTGSMAAATQIAILNIKGTVSANTGGTFIPQYSLSAAPGGAYSTVAGSYFAIWPIGAAGSNVSIGTWA